MRSPKDAAAELHRVFGPMRASKRCRMCRGSGFERISFDGRWTVCECVEMSVREHIESVNEEGAL